MNQATDDRLTLAREGCCSPRLQTRGFFARFEETSSPLKRRATTTGRSHQSPIASHGWFGGTTKLAYNSLRPRGEGLPFGGSSVTYTASIRSRTRGLLTFRTQRFTEGSSKLKSPRLSAWA